MTNDDFLGELPAIVAARPGSFCGPLARAYLKWFIRRTRNAKLPLGPKHVPIDVRAYWGLIRQSETTKGG
jgi:hypothetical protein